MMQKILYAISMTLFSVSLFAQKIENPQTKTPNSRYTSIIKRVIAIKASSGYITEGSQQFIDSKLKAMTIESFKKVKYDKLISVEDETGKFKKDTLKLPY